jgi:hypothetical protein
MKTETTDQGEQGIIPTAERIPPAQYVRRLANAKPKPRPDQSPPPAGGLFDPRGPAPLQTKLWESE